MCATWVACRRHPGMHRLTLVRGLHTLDMARLVAMTMTTDHTDTCTLTHEHHAARQA